MINNKLPFKLDFKKIELLGFAVDSFGTYLSAEMITTFEEHNRLLEVFSFYCLKNLACFDSDFCLTCGYEWAYSAIQDALKFVPLVNKNEENT